MRELERQRRQFQEQTARERRSIAAPQQQAPAGLDPSNSPLYELRGTERETLEMRLAIEETWQQLAGALSPASLTRSISIVRAKLADHYRQTLEQIGRQSEQLEAVRRDLGQQLTAIESQRQELQAWAERRHGDIEEQAARLVAREQELDRQQLHFEQMESRWQLERIDYQSEIRRLLAALRSVELKAA